MAEPKLHVVILAGGKGERLFPLSTETRPKQFLRLFGDTSMLQDTVSRCLLLPHTTISVCTIEGYEELTFDHLHDIGQSTYRIPIRTEKEAKGTAASIAYMLALYKANGAGASDLFLFCPCDHVIENQGNFVVSIKKAIDEIKGTDKLMLFGITAKYKESRFGYFLANYDNEVLKFVEKPDSGTIDYLMSYNVGTFWNTGIFLGSMEAFRQQFPSTYIPQGSFDSYCLTDKRIALGNILARNADSWGWDDIGNWESLIRHIATMRR